MFLPPIYPITDTRLSKLSHVEQVQRLVRGGATFVQLREKSASMKEFFTDARDAIAFARKNDAKIIINDRVDVALALQADGVHLGQDDLPPREARKILGESAIIGFSTHNLEQAVAALEFSVDYIAIGPIFKTNTKENADDAVGLDALRKIREAVGNFPLVAIGGINSTNFAAVLDAGANSVAVISDLISEPERISERVKLFLSKTNDL